MPLFQRIHVIVLDSLGIGEAPDAKAFGDEGADTLGHIVETVGTLDVPHLTSLGLGNIRPIDGLAASEKPLGLYGKMEERSVGKDTMTGHWEMMGLLIDKPFKTYPNGFPDELIRQLEERTGRRVIANRPASGTAIIEELGEEHMKTGALIVYTSADPVLQIAAHEEVVPLDELYRICEIARELTLQPDYLVGRVIARPFVGTPGAFVRTSNRHDYALDPFDRTVMNEMKDAGYAVRAVGKINDIYNGQGVTDAVRTTSNDHGVTELLRVMDESFVGMSFTNLVDFDAMYGHRRDAVGYAEAIRAFDARLPELMEALGNDLLIITADHGNDPTAPGTDHTREYVPLLVYSKSMQASGSLGIRSTFADVGATIADNFGIPSPVIGTSFLQRVKESM